MRGWRSLFGHDEPYTSQAEGIELALETVGSGGFLALEGACGTGKTMLALTAGLHLVRSENSPFERVFVVTSVKQQLRQFEADLARIHSKLPEGDGFGAVTLVGKADVCPYHLAGTGGMTSEVLYDRCEGLRDRTRELVDEGRPSNELARAAYANTGGFKVGSSSAPYTGSMPTTSAGGTVGEVEYCPFYAQYLADSAVDGEPAASIPFDYRSDGPLTPSELVDRGLAAGSCPHSLMGVLLQDAEVVVGNYYHAFDDRTVAAFTGPLVDDSTIFICDEAHMLESRVRDLASSSIALSTIRRSRSEIADVIEFAKGGRSRGARTVANEALTKAEIDRSTLSLLHTFLGEVVDAVESIVSDADIGDAETIPLREPTDPAPDALTRLLSESGYEAATWRSAAAVGPVVEYVLNAVDGEERWRATPAAGRFLEDWWRHDHESYFRTLDVDAARRKSTVDTEHRIRLSIHNCLPADAISSVLDRFGGGILMSATLEPMEVFTRVTGLNRIREAGRSVETARYDLTFPKENRLSLLVDAPKFTYRNRGPPGELNPTRAAHIEAIAGIARSPGNVLVGMPSYAEARWAAGVLSERLDRTVLLDQSSDTAETEDLKRRFFAGDAKVLVTSLRGTLTEGVDYEGDRLAAVAICGVPIINTGDPVTQATKTAYDRRFSNGFDHALVVPAVRKARQALGRVIRGPDEVGVRALIDGRYLRSDWDGVGNHLPTDDEFRAVSSDAVAREVDDFWDGHRRNT